MWRPFETIAVVCLLFGSAAAQNTLIAQPPENSGCASAKPCNAAQVVESPQQVFGPLFEAVQSAQVFPDSKTFADSLPKSPPAEILRKFFAEKPKTEEELRVFVSQNFFVPEQGRPSANLRDHIKALWPQLTRPAFASAQASSAIGLPQRYVVPGGRFREIYYWDSYFTMLGLKADDEQLLVESMLENFVSLIERFGHVPNGTRTYYLSRSQPPFLSLMMELSDAGDSALEARRLDALRTEYRYWMAGANCATQPEPCEHVVRMPDGSVLNRYWDGRDTPRDESYLQDVETAVADSKRSAQTVYRDLRAGAESGWDFSSRWLGDGTTLSTIHTTNIVPVDLNSLLWFLETAISRRCAAAGDLQCSADFDSRSRERKSAMSKYLWSAKEGRFGDWGRSTRKLTPSVSAAVLYPLFVGLATPEQAKAVAKLTEEKLIAPGGLRTTTVRTGQQWDDPNGWAPLTWIGVQGLDRYGFKTIADEIAIRWLTTVSSYFACTGRLVEKYDIESRDAGGGGEYAVQDGFGWTNGVTSALIERAGPNANLRSDCALKH